MVETILDLNQSVILNTMKTINMSEGNSLMNNFIAELRDVTIQNDPMRFRRNIERIGEIFAYEISKTLEFKSTKITTPLGSCTPQIMTENPVIATVLRAGLPLHMGILSYFDRSENCFISAYRRHTEGNNFEIASEYIASPSIEGKTVILCDPMLATGASLRVGYEAMLERGNPKHVHLVSIIASQHGVDYVREYLPSEKCTLWCGDIDPKLNEKAYIIPGLGDAGDLAFGPKL